MKALSQLSPDIQQKAQRHGIPDQLVSAPGSTSAVGEREFRQCIRQYDAACRQYGGNQK